MPIHEILTIDGRKKPKFIHTGKFQKYQDIRYMAVVLLKAYPDISKREICDRISSETGDSPQNVERILRNVYELGDPKLINLKPKTL